MSQRPDLVNRYVKMSVLSRRIKICLLKVKNVTINVQFGGHFARTAQPNTLAEKKYVMVDSVCGQTDIICAHFRNFIRLYTLQWKFNN